MKKARILICDDEEGIRESLDLILGRDYRLAFAADGEAAMAQAQQEPFDLALVDIKMPRMNGLELLKWFRQRQPTMPVIMLTAYQSVEMAQEATTLGAADYLPKPFEQASLKKAIARVLTSTAKTKKAPTA